MRRLIFILLAMIGVSQAQTIQYIGAPTTTVISRGNFRTDSIFYLPKRSKAPTDTAAFRYQISDSSLYVWTGSQWVKAGGSGTISGSGTTNYVPKFTASTTIGNSQIYDNGNIVGINTTSDAGYKLDVNGTLRSVNGANFATTSGNVGIGTASPSGKLHVTGASANTSNIYTTTGFSTFTDNGFSSNGIRGLFVGTPSIGDNLSVAYFSFGNGEYPVSMQFYSGSDIGARGSSLIPYIFRTVGSSTVSALYNDGGAYFAQNVGIATSSPTQKLDINGRARIRTIDSTTSPINILTSDPTGIIRKTSISAFNGITGTGTNNYIAKFTSTGNIGNSLIFDNSINIGINTNSPKYFNHILYRTNNHSQYDSRYKFILESDTATYFGLATKNNTYAGYRILDSSKAVASFDYYNNFSQLDIYSAGITSFRQNDIEAFRIFTNGRIGINTTTDAGDYKLQVAGNIYNTGSITTGAPSGGSIKPWKIGEAATVSPTSPNRTIRVEIDGTVYYLHAKTTND